jgi:hypothetical protein
MRRLNLTNATNPLNQRRKKTNNAIMTDAAKILKALTRKEVSRVRKRSRAKTVERKRVRRWKKETKPRSKSELSGRERKRG